LPVAAPASPTPKAIEASSGNASSTARLFWPTQSSRQRDAGPSASSSRSVTRVALGALDTARAGAISAIRQSPLQANSTSATSPPVHRISSADTLSTRGPTRRNVANWNWDPIPNRMNPIASCSTAWRAASVPGPSRTARASSLSGTSCMPMCGPSSMPTSR
jgi:hypothetical protein